MAEKKYRVLVLENEKEDSIQAMSEEKFLISAVRPDKAKTIPFIEEKPLFMVWDTDTQDFITDIGNLMEEIHIYEVPLLIITDSQKNPMLTDLVGAPLTQILIRPFTKEELIEKGITNGAVLASDAFFPFSDCVEEAHKAGIKAIIQPGGSIKDQDSIDACNKHGICMVFTKVRHFKH